RPALRSSKPSASSTARRAGAKPSKPPASRSTRSSPAASSRLPMPLFRRRPSEPDALTFTVGVDNHRVVVGGPDRGCELLTDVDGYIGSVQTKWSRGRDGRDSVALQNAKMDYAEMVETMIIVLSLTLEELAERA